MKTARKKRATVARDRFAHMLAALLGHVRGLRRERSIRLPGFAAYRIERAERGELLDEATALEIAGALHALQLIYRDEALLASRPNRHEAEEELQHAANAQALVELYGLDAASAIEAVAGNRRRVERDSLARTQRNRAEKARLLGVEPDWAVVEKAARRRKRTNKPEK